MTLDEAIRHCEEVVAKYEKQAFFSMSKEGKKYNCECAEEHKQLAEWLRELKERRDTVKRGKWEEIEDFDGDSHYGCTACGAEFYLEAGTPSDNEYYYCPHCGADLRRWENG